MVSRPEKMSEDELLALVGLYTEQASGYLDGELAQQRAKATRYYQAQPFGDEQEGHSQVILTDVMDTVEWMLPQLLEPFMAGDDVVNFAPTGPEDIEAAEQETAYVNHVFLRDNPGESILYTWAKDGLLSKNGVVKAWAEQYQTVNDEQYEGLTEFQLLELVNNPEIEVLAAVERPDETTGVLFDVSVKRTRDKKRIRVMPIPPEHFLISRRATSIETAPFVAHRERQTETELILEGHDPEVVRDLPSYDDDYSEERLERFAADDQWPYEEMQLRRANREIWTTECYVRVDFDGDGIAELRRVKYAGSTGGNISGSREGGKVLLVNEPWPHERAPFYSWTPVPITHKFYGMSVADLVMDIQHIRSTLMRQMLDAQYRAVNPKTAVWEQHVEMEDMLVSRAGGHVIRTTQPPQNVIFPIQTPPPDQTTYNLLEFMTNEREARSGVSRFSQGIDAGSINDTASGINQLMSAAQMRVKLIARLFAIGVADLFKGIHELVRKYQDVPRTIRLANRWVEIDPTEWSERMDTTVEVGLGASNRDLQLLHLDGIAQTIAQVVPLQGGLDGPLIHWRHVKNLIDKRAALATYKEPDLFCADPDDPVNQPPPREPPPDPRLIEIQVKAQQAQMELQAKQQEAMQKLQQTAAEAAEKVQLAYQELAAKQKLEEAKLLQARQEHEDEMAFKYAELEAQRQANDMEVIGKQIERSQAEHQARAKDIEASRARGETAEVESSRQAEVERLRAENLARERENLELRSVIEGQTRRKRAVVQRGPDGKMVGADIIEGPETIQ